MIEITNANEFYEENKRIYADSLKRWGVLQKSTKFKFLPEQKDVLGILLRERKEGNTHHTHAHTLKTYLITKQASFSFL
jgi:hypothetical protein